MILTNRRAAQAEVWEYEEESMVRFIREVCRVTRWSSVQIHAAHGRILMNAASLELPEQGYGRGAGLYPIYSMMNTSCR